MPLAVLLLLTSGCASTQPLRVVPSTVAPAPIRSVLVVGLSIENDRLVCVERTWAGGSAQFDCLTIGELRGIVFQRLVAENTR